MARNDDQLQLTITRHDQRTESRRLMRRVRADADRIAAQFGLQYKCIEAERTDVTEHYGVCYSDGTIRIQLRHAVTGKPLKYSSLMDTVCHELSHLRHFDHGERFEALFMRMLQWSREQGIYDPAPMAAARAATDEPPAVRERQLPLFGGERLRRAIAGPDHHE